MIEGIHHITAIASDARDNLRFYTEILGLRLVKKTVNQDDTATYHLFYGDRLGNPGMDLTFFIFLPAMQGQHGAGQVTTISLAVPKNSLSFWKQRLGTFNISHEDISTKFGVQRLAFSDNDGQALELVGLPHDKLNGQKDLWTEVIAEEYAIQNFYSATLSVTNIELIAPVLEHVFEYEFVKTEGHTHLFTVKESNRAVNLEVAEVPNGAPGFNAAGTVHHIAFRAADEKEQLAMRDKAIKLGLVPTEVIDRFYFKSVYFRTPAGILFEIATDGPGFTADQTEETLGRALALPPFLENQRASIEKNLIPLS